MRLVVASATACSSRFSSWRTLPGHGAAISSAIASGASVGTGSLVALGEPAQEMRREQRDVLAAIGERRQLERDDIEPVIEVFAELARRPFARRGRDASPK